MGGIDMQVQRATVALPEVCLDNRRGTLAMQVSELKLAYTTKLATDMPWLINAMKVTGQALGETFQGAVRASIQATQATHTQLQALLQDGNKEGDRKFQELVTDLESRGREAHEQLQEFGRTASTVLEARKSVVEKQLQEFPGGLKVAAKDVASDVTKLWERTLQGDVARDLGKEAAKFWDGTVQQVQRSDVAKDVARNASVFLEKTFGPGNVG